MPLNGSEAYDKDDFFQLYLQKRKNSQSPNDTLEKPYLNELIGRVEGLNFLDLGCGDGEYGLELLGKGATHYHGVDNSTNMLRLAEAALKGKDATLHKSPIETLNLSNHSFDRIISRLAFHYISDLEALARKIHSYLNSSGKLIFSIEHPVITSSYKNYNKGIKRGSWEVDDYFQSGKRINHWMGEEVVKYHRTLEEYFNIFQENGFKFETLKESKPKLELFEDKELYERRARIPLFLIFKWEKAGQEALRI
ncbi:MAG: methyltransferase domain-containing protein [Bacteroidia bacterium]|nr:methyltransferase domain-containing protein [Bacteroidia bacterium]